MDDGVRVGNYGQVFTNDEIVEKMLSLITNKGRVLEPSCGDGSFAKSLPRNRSTFIELDPTIAFDGAKVMDFFDLDISEKFDTIIGNPPYVRFQDILPSTKSKLNHSIFDKRSNLYLFFIEKCIRHLNDNGELIFITPRDFAKATASRKLNEMLFNEGTITHFEETGDSKIFGKFMPNCVIFRFQKGNKNRILDDGRKFSYHDGQLTFMGDDYCVPFKDIFHIHVGAVSGLDEVLANGTGTTEMVCSKTVEDGSLRRVFYNEKHPSLESSKERLKLRKMKNFHDGNWWHWGRGYYLSSEPRIYVNCKTRKQNPFFVNDCKAYDGSVMAIFPHKKDADVIELAKMLNEVDWESSGFVCDGRYLFSHKSLETTLLPSKFKRFAINK